MAYAIRTDLEAAYGAAEIAQRESMLPAGAVDRALADADAFIDGYASGRYAVPLSPVPANVLRLACAIARYNLLGDAATDRARADYEDAVAWLKDLAAGRVTLVSATLSASPATGGRPVSITPARIFNAAGLADY